MPANDSITKWLEENKALDFPSLMLKAGNSPEKRHAALQREARRKAASKLPHFLTYQDFTFPSLLLSEQCTSEPIADFHAALTGKVRSAIDLTAGLGIDAFTMSRFAAETTAVEIDPDAAHILEQNAARLGVPEFHAVCADCMDYLRSCKKHFDVAFIDPYRRDSGGSKVISFSRCTPDVPTNLALILEHASRLIVKASPMHDISLAINELGGHVSDVYTVGTPRECKELILVCTPETFFEPKMHAVTVFSDGNFMETAWHAHEATSSESIFATPSPGQILLEPYPAMMKSGAFAFISNRFKVKAISPATHLYLSDVHVPKFHGYNHEILQVMPFNKKAIKDLSKNHTHLNVATRNFPIKASELEKRIGLKPGGELKLFGVTLYDGAKALILTRKHTGD